jgi:hypothetical protein
MLFLYKIIRGMSCMAPAKNPVCSNKHARQGNTRNFGSGELHIFTPSCSSISKTILSSEKITTAFFYQPPAKSGITKT